MTMAKMIQRIEEDMRTKGIMDNREIEKWTRWLNRMPKDTVATVYNNRLNK